MKSHTQSGVALIYAVLVAGALLTIAFALSAIFIPKIRTSGQSKRSVTALYAAESGLEWCLMVIDNDPFAPKPQMKNGGRFLDARGDPLDAGDCVERPLKVIGEFEGVTRAFELVFPR